MIVTPKKIAQLTHLAELNTIYQDSLNFTWFIWQTTRSASCETCGWGSQSLFIFVPQEIWEPSRLGLKEDAQDTSRDCHPLLFSIGKWHNASGASENFTKNMEQNMLAFRKHTNFLMKLMFYLMISFRFASLFLCKSLREDTMIYSQSLMWLFILESWILDLDVILWVLLCHSPSLAVVHRISLLDVDIDIDIDAYRIYGNEEARLNQKKLCFAAFRPLQIWASSLNWLQILRERKEEEEDEGGGTLLRGGQ